jgi:uncharacterized protein (TIGR04255 family)
MDDVADLSSELAFYARSPVVEVAVGIEFLQLPGLGAVRLVGLHELWKDSFPKIQEQPALPPTAPMNMRAGFQVQVGFQIANGLPPLRVWMLNDAEDELLQVQSDRLLLNWRKALGSDRPYPRYAHLKEVYQQVFGEFQSHVQQSDVGTFKPHTAVVTYVNRFALDPGESLKDAFGPLNPDWEGLPGGATEVRQMFPLWNWIPGDNGGQVSTVAGIDPADPTFGYLEVVTRVNLEQPGIDPMGALDSAHTAGVHTFGAVTTEKMHERWGKA